MKWIKNTKLYLTLSLTLRNYARKLNSKKPKAHSDSYDVLVVFVRFCSFFLFGVSFVCLPISLVGVGWRTREFNFEKVAKSNCFHMYTVFLFIIISLNLAGSDSSRLIWDFFRVNFFVVILEFDCLLLEHKIHLSRVFVRNFPFSRCIYEILINLTIVI